MELLKLMIKTSNDAQQNVLDNLQDAFARFKKTEPFIEWSQQIN